MFSSSFLIASLLATGALMVSAVGESNALPAACRTYTSRSNKVECVSQLCSRDSQHFNVQACKRFSSPQVQKRDVAATFNFTIIATETSTPTPQTLTAVSTVQVSVPDASTTTAIAIEPQPTTVTQTELQAAPTVTEVPALAEFSVFTPVQAPKFDKFLTCDADDKKCHCHAAHQHMEFLQSHYAEFPDAIADQRDVIDDVCFSRVTKVHTHRKTMTSTTTSTSLSTSVSIKEISGAADGPLHASISGSVLGLGFAFFVLVAALV